MLVTDIDDKNVVDHFENCHSQKYFYFPIENEIGLAKLCALLSLVICYMRHYMALILILNANLISLNKDLQFM